MKKGFLILFVYIFFFILAIEDAWSIPAFARKYNMSCQTCHSPIPRLKSYGNDFAGSGFRLSDKEAPRYFLETGDEILSLIRDLPLAVRFDGFLSFNFANKEQLDLGVPYILKILSGGEISDKLSYYFYFYLSERGELVGVEDCYLMYNNLFGTDFDIYFGQFQVSDPLFKRELRLSLEDYQIYKVKPGLSKMNYAYDRGFMFTYGFDWGTDLIFEVVNGCGLTQADASKLFDIDKHKTFIGRISQDIGEMFRIGGIVLSGQEDMSNQVSGTITNGVFSWGADMTFHLDDVFELNLQYIQRKDDNLLLTDQSPNGANVETKGAMAELIFTPNRDQSRWYAVSLLNWVESDDTRLNYKTATLHLGYLLRRNLRLVLEGTYNFTNANSAFGLFSVGFVSAF